jgi:hypothetical protein
MSHVQTVVKTVLDVVQFGLNCCALPPDRSVGTSFSSLAVLFRILFSCLESVQVPCFAVQKILRNAAMEF